MGHALMENRHGLAVGGEVTHATGTAERAAALDLVNEHRPGRRRITLGADKTHDVAAFVKALQRLVPALRPEDIQPGGSDVRAQAVTREGALVDDFRIVQSADAIHVLNAPSPGATASLAIGRHIAGLAAETFQLR